MNPEEGGREEPAVVAQDPLSRLIVPLGWPVGLGFLFVTVFTFFEVVMRYLFNAPTFWVHETTTAMTAICFAFGGAYCLATDRHIRVVLLYDAAGPRTRRWLDIAISLVSAVSCALMAWAAWSLASRAFFTPQGGFRIETSGSAWNPPTPAIVKAVLFAMLCIMCVQFLLQALRHIRRDPSDTHHGQPGEGVYDDA